MTRITRPAGTTLSYDRHGACASWARPPLRRLATQLARSSSEAGPGTGAENMLRTAHAGVWARVP